MKLNTPHDVAPRQTQHRPGSDREGRPELFPDLNPNQTLFTACFIWDPGETVPPRSLPWQRRSHFRSVMAHYHPAARIHSPLTSAGKQPAFFTSSSISVTVENPLTQPKICRDQKYNRILGTETSLVFKM